MKTITEKIIIGVILGLCFVILFRFPTKNEQVDRCHRMQRFAMAGFPPTLSERIDCEDVGVKVILVPNETTE